MKISKFGGSSVASSAQIKKVCDIVNSDEDRRVVVVSAPGKRHADDTKVTDHFITLYEAVIKHQDPSPSIEQILARYEEIIDDLELSTILLDRFRSTIHNILQSLNNNPPRLLDALKSLGEDFNAQLIAVYNTSQGHATTYLSPLDIGLYVTDEPGNAMILEESYALIKDSLSGSKKVIVPGFFGYSKNHDIVTFSRGGSDLTGAIIANAMDAELYENFTDVSGIYSANPAVIASPQPIETLTYDEMRELSYAGFNVFHDEAIAPLIKKGIPVVIKNTNAPDDKGTVIQRERNAKGVVGVSCDKGFVSINMKKYLMNREVGFTRKLLSLLEAQNISYEHMPSGIDNISIILRAHELDGKEEHLLGTIISTLNVDEISIEKNLAIIMIVGEGMKTAIGTANNATKAFSKSNINIKMINQGSSEISMMFGIDEDDADEALKAIYKAYF